MAARALRRSRHFSSYAALSAGVLAFSTSGALTKLTSAPSVTIAFWVRVFSLAYLVAMFLFHNRRRRGDLLAGAWPHGLAAGLIFGVHILLYFWALKLTSVTVVFLLGALNPAVVGVFGWLFLNERLRPSQAFWTAMAIVAGAVVLLAIPGAIRRPDVPPTFEPIPQPLDGTVDRAVT